MRAKSCLNVGRRRRVVPVLLFQFCRLELGLELETDASNIGIFDTTLTGKKKEKEFV